MKKLIAFAVVFALIAGVAFAQLANGISINGWGRGAFAPLAFATDFDRDGKTVKNTGGVYTGIGATWGGTQVRTDFRVNANSENVGFVITFTEDGIGHGDDGMQIWAKPFGSDILKLTIGRFVNDTLRGKVGSVKSGYECFSLHGNNEEDQIFERFSTSTLAGNASTHVWNEGGGWMISSSPMEGLFLGLMVNGGLDPWWNGYMGRNANGTTLAGDAFRHMQFGAGFELPDMAHIRLQWVGGWAGELDMKQIAKDVEKNYYTTGYWDNDKEEWVEFDMFDERGRIEFAFAFTGMQGLLIDFGVKFWMPITVKGNKDFISFRGIDASLGANFRADAFNIAARVDAKNMGGHTYSDKKDKSFESAEIDVRLTPAYDMDAATIGLDIGFRTATASTTYDGKDGKDGTVEFGFGIFVKKGFGNGHVKAGVTLTTPKLYNDGKNNFKTNGGNDSNAIIRIPVVLEYAFF